MRTTLTGLVLGTIIAATTVHGVATASGERDGNRKVDFIGVFRPIPIGFVEDPIRCPEPSHRFLLTFQGIAFTTLGRATFTQSHCEAADHTSFRRGEQTITFDTGDELFGSYSGVLLRTATTATDGRLIIDGIYRNVGGTGAFENAHGRGISIGVVDTATGIATVTVSGKL